MLFTYKDKTVLVTGASAGIGKEMALQLAARGAHLVLVARREERLRALADEIMAKHGMAVEVVATDLKEPDAAARLYERLRGRKLQVDVLVNNAGIGLQRSFAECSPERLRDLLRLNIEALVDLTRCFLPPMLERGEGGVLNVASMVGFQPVPGYQAYAASKAFVLSFTESLRYECAGKGVHVSCLCPGATETEFFDAAGIDISDLRAKGGVQSAEAVAKAGLQGLLRNKAVVIPALPLKLMYHLSRHLPRAWVTAIAGRMASAGKSQGGRE